LKYPLGKPPGWGLVRKKATFGKRLRKGPNQRAEPWKNNPPEKKVSPIIPRGWASKILPLGRVFYNPKKGESILTSLTQKRLFENLQ